MSAKSKLPSTSPQTRRPGYSPEEALRRAANILLDHEKVQGPVWDPGSRENGTGMAIMAALVSHGISSFRTAENFMTADYDYPSVMTEPDPRRIEDYLRRAMKIATSKVVFLLPVPWLTQSSTKILLEEFQPTRIYMLTKKPMYRKSPMFWAIWEKGNYAAPVFRLL